MNNSETAKSIRFFHQLLLLISIGLVVMGFPVSLIAQTAEHPAPISTTQDTTLNQTSLLAGQDSLTTDDSLAVDTVVNKADKEAALGIKISEDALPATVNNTADDSAVLDVGQKIFYLYGNASASYQDIKITSGKLIFHQEDNTLEAVPIKDTADKVVSKQEFVQGGEKFTYDTMRYNFRSKRAIVRNARTQYGEGFVISHQVKRNADESIYGWKSLYTTCDLAHPHYGIRANRIKVIPGQIIASGPANLEIEDVPTPLFLPFGLFPIKKGQHSGFVLPTYTMEERRGVGLMKGGYYFAVNDNLGVITQFDLFSKGSWAFYSTFQYANRYHYSGNFSLNYSYTKIGESYEPNSNIQRDFRVEWRHQVDPKAHPGTNFSANVNFGTSTYNQVNGMENYNNILDNQYSSSISYSKTWPGKPYSLSIALRHNQSTQSHRVTVSLPEINFNLGQFTPFQRKEMIGKPKWYEKISVTYSFTEKNNWNFIDSTLNINDIRFRDFDNGILHSANISASYKILRYFTLSFNAPYQEYWNTKQAYFHYNQQTRETDTAINTGFYATRDFNLSAALSTRIYGLKMFKRGKIMGLRHVITPTVTATYTPGFAHAPFGYMYETVDAYGYSNYQSPYRLSPIGGPMNPNNSGTVNFSLANTLQMKVRTQEGDSASSKNISLIDGLGISGNYDLFADSFNMSMVSVNFHTSLLNKINVSANASFDPYVYKNGFKTPEYLINNGGGPAAFRSANFSMGFNLKGDRKDNGRVDSAANNNDQISRLLDNGGINDYYDFNIPWNASLNGGISIIRQVRRGKSDTTIFNPNLTFSGGFNLTERWQINFNSGLQFTGLKKVEMGLTNISISRDLHCWQMSLNIVPFGYYRSFNFTLRVKASVLQDLKLVRRRSYQDNY